MGTTPQETETTTGAGTSNGAEHRIGTDIAQQVVDFIRTEYCQPIWQQLGEVVHEPDEYSRLAIQLGVLGDDQVLGAVRLIPGQHNQITSRLAIPMQPGWVELSRLVVHRQHRGNSAILFTLLMEAHRVARENGYTHFIAAINRNSEKIFRAFGFLYTILQKNVEYFGWPTNVVTWEIAAAEARLRDNELFDPQSLSASLTTYQSR